MFHYEVDFMSPVPVAEVIGLGARCLSEDSNLQCNKLFEEGTEKRAISRYDEWAILAVQKVVARSLQ